VVQLLRFISCGTRKKSFREEIPNLGESFELSPDTKPNIREYGWLNLTLEERRQIFAATGPAGRRN
jgi:hypothetical protein